jgi:hypothetical protein
MVRAGEQMTAAAGQRGRRRAWHAVLATLGAVVAALGGAAPAVAASSTSGAAACDQQVLSQPFLPFLDPAWYTPVEDAGLERGGKAWDLHGGAAVVAGNEPYFVASPHDVRSLSLQAGASATTAPVCVTVTHPTVRFFIRNTGSPLALLNVEALIVDGDAIVERLPVATLAGSGVWAPTLPLPILANALAPVAGDGTLQVRFRFTPVLGGDWRVDDVYVDPYKVV